MKMHHHDSRESFEGQDELVRFSSELDGELDRLLAMWGDDGFVLRFPDVDAPPDSDLMLPEPGEVTDLLLRQLSATALFAAKFRESAARALESHGPETQADIPNFTAVAPVILNGEIHQS